MKKIQKKHKVLLVMILILAVTVVAFILWMQSGNSGEIKQSSASMKQGVQTGNRLHDGRYMQFSYPAGYTTRTIEQRGDDLELLELNADTAYVKKVSVSISNLPGGDLSNNSAYLLRKSYTDKYRQRPFESGQLQAEIWASLDGTEQTVFITHDERVATLAFTQQGGDKVLLDKEVDEIIRSFKWK